MKTGVRPLANDPERLDPEPRFRIIAELGEGGMAKVHLAAARGPSGFNKLVVLKALRSSLANDPECLDMFLHEARLAARLNHPNVVQTYEVTAEGDRPVIVMEYLEGEPLSRVVLRARKEKPLPLAMHTRILCDTLAGLHYAHELHDFDGTRLELVHRDVSPQNVFVTFEGQVKILDFGIAKAAIAAPTETETGVLKGKVRYMAPEQMAGAAVDRRADIFAVGAMLWEALAGQRIWSGVPDVIVMQRLTAGDIPSPRTCNPNVPERFERICLKAMSVQPGNRFETARHFEIELEAALAEMSGTIRQRDIGNFVAELFADTRAEIKVVIESQMSRAANLSSREFATVSPVSLYGLTHMSTGSRPGASNDSRSNQLKGPIRNRLLTVFLILLGVFGSFAMLVWKGSIHSAGVEQQRGIAAPTGATSALPSASEPAPLSPRVELRIAATPSQSRVFFDERELASNPYVLSRSPDVLTHRVRAEAPGYTAQTVEVTLDRSAVVRIALEHDGAALLVSRPAANLHSVAPLPVNHAPTSSSDAAARAALEKPNCTQPYYFDEQGIKRIRAECL
jgi:eukaryotic-like serine/threonine-protein kinase